MPSVSDLIAIQLRIDTSGVTGGAQQASRDMQRATNQIQQQASQVEYVVKNIAENVFTALRRIAGLLGVALSIEGVRRLTETFADAQTSLGRFSEAVGVSVTNVSALEQAFDRAGGKAGDVRSVLQAMRSDITHGQMTGQPAEWMKTLGRAPFQFGLTNLVRMQPEDILLQISQRAGAAHLTAAQLQQFLPGLPLSPESLAVLSNPAELQRLLSDIRRQQTAVTPDQVKAGEALKEKLVTLENITNQVLNDLVTLAEPILSRLIDWMTTALSWVDRIERALLGEQPTPAMAPTGGFSPSGRSGGGAAPPYSPRTFFGRDAGSIDLSSIMGGKEKIAGGIDRSRFEKEILSKPWLVRKMASMVQGEVGKGAPLSTKIVQLETAFNRAQARGHSLEQALLSVTEDPRRGYYAADTYHFISDADVERFKTDVLGPVLRGSDISSQGGKGPMTGNASAQVAAHQFARGTPGYNLPAAGGMHESYFAEGPFKNAFPRIPPSPSSVVRVPNVSTGAGAALETPPVVSTTENNETTAVINHVIVNTNATSAVGIAKDVKDEIGRQLSLPGSGD